MKVQRNTDGLYAEVVVNTIVVPPTSGKPGGDEIIVLSLSFTDDEGEYVYVQGLTGTNIEIDGVTYKVLQSGALGGQSLAYGIEPV